MDWTRTYTSFQEFAERNGISQALVEEYLTKHDGWFSDALQAYVDDHYGENSYVTLTEEYGDTVHILKINQKDPIRRLKESNKYLLWCIQQKMERGEKKEEWIKLYDNLKELLKCLQSENQ